VTPGDRRAKLRAPAEGKPVMIVYGSSLSPFVRKVLVFIAEKGLTAEHKPIAMQDQSPEFRACSALGKIPGFSDGAFQLADSTAICHYLERRYPMPALFPSTAEDYGRMVWFEEFADTLLIPAAGKVFFNLVVKPRFLDQPADQAVVDKALADELPPLFDYLEGQIAGPFLVGSTLSLADITVAQPFVNLTMAERPLDTGRWPKLGRYVAALAARPGFARTGDRKAAA
jgi:glutathione S-transferase